MTASDGSPLTPADVLTESSLSAVVERLKQWRTMSNNALAVTVIDAGSCLDEMADGTRPGWLFDQTVDRELATLICAQCLVREACLELELRLFGAAKHGMWGPLGEDGRRALHPAWAQAREDAAHSESRGDRR